MNSGKSDILLFTLPNLQNLDFHLTKVPDDKINRKEEKEMKQTFRLKKQSFTFDKKGMILRGRMMNGGRGILVRAWDMYLDNKNIMSDDENSWWSDGRCSYLREFTEQLFPFVKWVDKKYYVIEDVLENYEIVED